MPFNELQRRDSWPPTILRIHDDDADIESEIDDNPISFFLTSPEDADFFDDDAFDLEDLSAGIETDDPSKPVVREISPSSLQRTSREAEVEKGDGDEEEEEEEEDVEFGLAMPLSLKDFTTRHINTRSSSSGRKSRAGQHTSEDLPKGLGIDMPDFKSSRGRAKVRLSPKGRGRGRSQTRSLSARRSQSWRVPSPDIWSIEEESEEGSPRDEKKEIEMGISVSAPATAHIEQVATVKKAKSKKRVHWAF